MSVSGAATLLIGISLIGQVLGFLRVKLVNANFAATGPGSTDAFFAAFKIPDLFFVTIAAGALGVAFIPFLADKLEKGDRKGAWKITSSLLNLLWFLTFLIGVAIFVFAEPLISNLVAPGMSPEQLDNAVLIMRLIALNPLFFTIAGILMSVQQTVGRFFFYAIAPLFYNLAIIVSIFVFRNNIGIVGLGIGAAVGAFLQLIVAIIGMWGTQFHYSRMIAWHDTAFKGILRQLPARSVDQGIDAINSIVETNFAARLGEGRISYYENAYVIHTTPILLIGTAISTAAFPKLSERLSQGRPDLFRKEFIQVLRAMIWISMPVILVSYFARGYLARIIFTQDAPQIALILGFLCGAIFFRIIYQIISRYFYAHKDSWTPLVVSIVTIALNIYLAFSLTHNSTYNVAGLALAQTLAAAFEVIVLVIIIMVRDRHLFTMKFVGDLMRILSATGFAIVATFIMVTLFPLQVGDRGFITLGTKLVAISAVTFTVYVSISWLFNIEESKPVVARIKNLILRPIRINW
jgi:putative peptidoglycan lipid II flippase